MYPSRVCATLDIDERARSTDADRMHLTDLLVAIAVFGVVSAAVFTVLQEGLRLYAIGASRAESQQSGRVAVERLAGEIRTAGLGPRSATFPAISVAEPTHIVLHHDLDGDGLVTGAGETVIWRLDGKTMRRGRRRPAAHRRCPELRARIPRRRRQARRDGG
jgi:hypothetical protein